MTRTLYCLLGALLLLATLVSGERQSSAAGTANSNMAVSATVATSCSIQSVANMAFGSYEAESGTPLDTSSAIVVRCSMSTPYTVALDAGLNPLTTQRRMSDGGAPANYVLYDVYQDAGRTTPWIPSGTVGGTGTGGAQTVTAYGRMPINQYTVPAGSYTDTVVVTLTW